PTCRSLSLGRPCLLLSPFRSPRHLRHRSPGPHQDFRSFRADRILRSDEPKRTAPMAAPVIEKLCDAVSGPTMMGHLEQFARWQKPSGTPEERASLRYVQERLDGFGFATRLIEHDAYISLPGKARVEVDGRALDCITHSFSRSSGPGGTRGRVVYAGM